MLYACISTLLKSFISFFFFFFFVCFFFFFFFFFFNGSKVDSFNGDETFMLSCNRAE